MEKEIFRINEELVGKSIIVRFVPNIKDVNKSIISYKLPKVSINSNDIKRYLALVLIDDDLEVFEFTQKMYDFITNSISKDEKIFFLNHGKAIKINVSLRSSFIYTDFELIDDEKYRLNKTPDEKEYILRILNNSNLDLMETYESEMKRLNEIKIANNLY